MADGFEQEHLVIYKLGQVESTLKSVGEKIDKLVDTTAKAHTELSNRIEDVASRTTELEQFRDKFKTETRMVAVLTGGIFTLLVTFKEFIFRWLHLP